MTWIKDKNGEDMSSIITEYVKRYQHTSFVSEAEKHHNGISPLYRRTKDLANSITQKIFEECVNTTSRNGTYIIEMDVYVLSHSDLKAMITQIQEEARQDERKFGGYYER